MLSHNTIYPHATAATVDYRPIKTAAITKMAVFMVI